MKITPLTDYLIDISKLTEQCEPSQPETLSEQTDRLCWEIEMRVHDLLSIPLPAKKFAGRREPMEGGERFESYPVVLGHIIALLEHEKRAYERAIQGPRKLPYVLKATAEF